MSIQVEQTSIEGLLLIKPEIHKDHRGSYTEIYDNEKYKDILPEGTIFVQDDYSHSKQNVLRGIHGDASTAKLISIIYGQVFDAVIDNRPNSPTYLKVETFHLSRENAYQLFIPEGCGNGMLALSPEVIFHYKQTTHYIPGIQFTIMWDDPRFVIPWPVTNPILSDRDKKGNY
jgi:dTDP-4-dehydrorhamnose 3,5-epimerase